MGSCLIDPQERIDGSRIDVGPEFVGKDGVRIALLLTRKAASEICMYVTRFLMQKGKARA
jgi:hypothetical protein